MIKILRIIIFGPPGVGKGTLSEMIIEHCKIAHISTGDMIRDLLNNDPEFSHYKKMVDEGKLLPDEAVISMIEKRLKSPDCKDGFILDGFPRNIAQAEFLDTVLTNNNLKLDKVIDLTASDEVIIDRISGRRICTKCGAIYHIKNFPPKKGGICKECGSKVIQRKDDTPEVVRGRLKTYRKDTEPIMFFYKAKGLLEQIDTNKPVKKIFNQLFKGIKKKCP